MPLPNSQDIQVPHEVWGGIPNIAPNSGAILSGGSVIRGPYNYNDNLEPSDPNYAGGVNSPSTLTYADGFVRGTFPLGADGSGNVPYTRIGLPENTQEFYMEFDARFPSDVVGLKFFKVFGIQPEGIEVGSSNMTAGPNYSDSNNFDRISFGDGAGTDNDTQNAIMLDGTSNASLVGRGWATAQINTPVGKFTPADWGTDWHHFKYFCRYNTGTTAETEIPDGAFYLEIDGVLYADIGGIYNRNWQNSQFINNVGLFGYTQGQASEFYLDRDNDVILTGGFE